MTEYSSGGRARQLPVEIILLILECAVDRDPGRLKELASLSKSVYSYLYSRFAPDVHVYSRQGFLRFVRLGWPDVVKDALTRANGKGINLELYLHFNNLLPDEEGDHYWPRGEEYWPELSFCLESISEPIRLNMETLGMSTICMSSYYMSSGLWAIKLYPNVKRFYVDATPFSPWEPSEDEIGYLRLSDNLTHRLLEDRFMTDANQIETYALSATGYDPVFEEYKNEDHPTGPFVAKTFPNLQRLFLFWWYFESVLESGDCDEVLESLDPIIDAFDGSTPVKMIVHILVVESESDLPKFSDKIQRKLYEATHGSMVIRNVIVWQWREME
jgi:hypothetical protein